MMIRPHFSMAHAGITVDGARVTKRQSGWNNGVAIVDGICRVPSTLPVHVWRFRITNAQKKATFGIVNEHFDIEEDGYVNKTTRGWGLYQADGNIGHGGSAKTPYTEGFDNGAVVEVRLDPVAKTLSFSVNGKDMNVAFRDLPHGIYRGAVSLFAEGSVAEVLACPVSTTQPAITSPTDQIKVGPTTKSCSGDSRDTKCCKNPKYDNDGEEMFYLNLFPEVEKPLEKAIPKGIENSTSHTSNLNKALQDAFIAMTGINSLVKKQNVQAKEDAVVIANLQQQINMLREENQRLQEQQNKRSESETKLKQKLEEVKAQWAFSISSESKIREELEQARAHVIDLTDKYAKASEAQARAESNLKVLREGLNGLIDKSTAVVKVKEASPIGHNPKKQAPIKTQTPDQKFRACIKGSFSSYTDFDTKLVVKNNPPKYGKHNLHVDQDTGNIHASLFGGNGDYVIMFHHGSIKTTVATCGPSLSNLKLTPEAKAQGWTINIDTKWIIAPSHSNTNAKKSESGDKTVVQSKADKSENLLPAEFMMAKTDVMQEPIWVCPPHMPYSARLQNIIEQAFQKFQADPLCAPANVEIKINLKGKRTGKFHIFFDKQKNGTFEFYQVNGATHASAPVFRVLKKF